jgi:hypothetical protein
MERDFEKRQISAAHLIGVAAVSFSALYLLSDVTEALHGGFSVPQLLLTLVAEAAIPFITIGLYAVQRPRIGRLGLISAFAYAYAFAFFTGTVVYALVNGTNDYSALSDDLGALMTAQGAIMAFAGMGLALLASRSPSPQHRTDLFNSVKNRAVAPGLK